MTRSYASGVASKPLIGETIGENLERTVARFGDREALVVRHQDVRLTYEELNAQVDALARGLLGAGLRKGDRVGHLGAQPRRVGAHPVRHRQGRDHPRQRQPGLPHDRAPLRARPVGLPDARRGPRLQDERLRRHDRGGPRRAARARARRAARLARVGSADGRRRARARPRRARLRRPDQHPVHERHHGLPQGRHAQPPQHPQQRVLRQRGLRPRRARPRLHPRALLPLLRDGHGQPRLHHARRRHGRPRGGVRARGRARRRAGGALHEPLRRADHVHRRAQPPALRRVRPVVAADRDHGRLAVPDRGHEAGHRADAHGRGDHLLRHDRDLAGVDPDRAPATRSRSARRPSAASTRTSRSSSSTPPPAPRWSAASPASCSRAATASWRATGTTPSARPRRSTRTAGCTPATWPRWTRTAT